MREPGDLLGPMRLPFLVLPPACVFLAFGTALWTEGGIDALYLILAFVGAVAAHIGVNALNEYFDFVSGLDKRTQRTLFSGGSGTLPARPEMARPALYLGLLTMALAGSIGIYFLFVLPGERKYHETKLRLLQERIERRERYRRGQDEVLDRPSESRSTPPGGD